MKGALRIYIYILHDLIHFVIIFSQLIESFRFDDEIWIL